MIAVIDYNIGNLASVSNGLKRQGLDVVITRDEKEILSADGIVLPGVGAFPVAMENLKKFNLIEPLNKAKEQGTPIMGICLGMQILFEKGYEVEETAGLGFLKGEVDLLKVDAKLPHMGWNQLVVNHDHPLLKYVKEGDYVYFVHSYGAICPDEELMAYAQYGGAKISALVAKDNVIGCQFHPEKSGEVGKCILHAFKELCEK
jgi:glutamine amidotransferase